MNDRHAFINSLVASEQQQRTAEYERVELDKYYTGRDRVVPYVPPTKAPEPVDTGAFTPTQVRLFKGFGIAGTMITFWASFFTAAATGAMNTIFQYGAGGLFLVFILSGLKGAASGTTGTGASGGGGGRSGGGGNQYNQQNNYHNCNF